MRRALPQLVDAHAYSACDWDLIEDELGRTLWLDVFERQVSYITECAVESGYDAATANHASDALRALFRSLRSDPRALGDTLDILVIDRARDGLLRDCGIDDAFRGVKDRETARALTALPSRLETLDAVPEEKRFEELIRGVFAGNLFDMGSEQTATMFLGGSTLAFERCLDRAPKRPWDIDGFDGARLDGWGHALLFVDNAGADVILGILPLARELLRRGARVTLAANERPSLNDVTAKELRPIVEGISDLRGARVLSTGSQDPLVDLSDLDASFCDEVEDADLVVLEGMGRGLESNWLARLSCEAWRIAIVKAEPVSIRRGAAMFGGVFRRDNAHA